MIDPVAWMDYLKKDDHILLSPFSSNELIDLLTGREIKMTFFDTTLEGSPDLLFLKRLNLKNYALFLYDPFCGNDSELPALTAQCQSADLPIVNLKQSAMNRHFHEIFSIYQKSFSPTKDFTFFKNYYPDHVFPIFLMPQFFCPKEEIINALSDQDISITLLTPVYKDPQYAFTESESALFGAGECYRSFIGLPYEVTKDKAYLIAETLMKILDRHSLRRCSF